MNLASLSADVNLRMDSSAARRIMRAETDPLRSVVTTGRTAAEEGVVEIEVSVRELGDVRIVDARGRATIGESSDRLHSELRHLIEHGWRKILVNLTDLTAIDSTGISVLVRNCTHLTRAGGSLKLVCPAGRVRDALAITRLVEVITTFDNEAAGLASFR